MNEFDRELFQAQLESNDEVASNFFRANQEKIEAYNALPEKDYSLTDGKTIKARCTAEANAKLEQMKRNKKIGKLVEFAQPEKANAASN